MSISSLQESESAAAEAELLCALIAQNADPLRKAALGRSVQLEDARFKLFGTGRNTIYRVRRGRSWFLKLTRSGEPGPVARESRGNDAVRTALDSAPFYYHPPCVRASEELAYVLCAEIPGRQLNATFYRAALFPWRGNRERARTLLAHTGQTLARLHATPVADAPLVNRRDTLEAIGPLLQRAKEHDRVSEAIESRFGAVRPRGEPDCFVHGHTFPWNIIVTGPRLSLIDFENCGIGPRYVDLVHVMLGFLVAGVLPLVSRSFVEACVASVAEGYRRDGSYDRDTLRHELAARVALFYVEEFLCGKSRPTIAGIPVSRKRVAKLVLELLNGRDPGI